MSNIKVSSDIDTFLKKSTKEEAASFLGLENSGQVETNKTNIATNTANIATNTSNIATNTAKVGITPAQASAIAANTLKDGITTAQATAIATNTSNITSHSAQLILNRDYSDALQVEVDANYNSIGLLGSTLPNSITQNSNNIATNAADIVTLQNDKAPLASPILTGNPTAPTQSANDDSTKIATTAYVDAVTSPNNKGFFATESALTTTYSSGSNGWFAIVGATDTFWVWDSGTSSWVNTDSNSQGTVTSINITDGTGITSTGGAVTTSGSITVGLDSATQATLVKVDTNESNISTNTASIATNASAIQTNTANITTNTAGIASLATAVNANTNYISAVAPTITGHTTAISAHTASISANTNDISGNTNDISANTNDIGTNEDNIAINTGNIATNTASIATNSSAILANTADITTNATNISTTASSVAMNVANIATNVTDIVTLQNDKAPKNAPTFTGIVKADTLYYDVHEVLNLQDHTLHSNDGTEIFNFIDKEELIFNPTTRLGVGGTADSTTKLHVVGTTRVDGAFKVNANYAGSFYDTILEVDPSANKLVTMKNAKVDGDLQVDDDLNVDGNVTIDGNTTCANDFISTKVDGGKIELTGNVNGVSGGSAQLVLNETSLTGSTGRVTQQLDMLTFQSAGGPTDSDFGGFKFDSLNGGGSDGSDGYCVATLTPLGLDIPVGKLSVGKLITSTSETLDVDGNIKGNKLITSEIQCLGDSSATAQPINYDAKEHRFRDVDAEPDTLMVVRKVDGFTGPRISMGKDSADATLHIVAGKNNSTNVKDEALRVVGRAFFDDSIRVGHYLDADRPTSSSTPSAQDGMIIYNSTHDEFQGYVGGAGWQRFIMAPVSL